MDIHALQYPPVRDLLRRLQRRRSSLSQIGKDLLDGLIDTPVRLGDGLGDLIAVGGGQERDLRFLTYIRKLTHLHPFLKPGSRGRIRCRMVFMSAGAFKYTERLEEALKSRGNPLSVDAFMDILQEVNDVPSVPPSIGEGSLAHEAIDLQ